MAIVWRVSRLVSIAELARRGVVVSPEEAVAIAQEMIRVEPDGAPHRLFIPVAQQEVFLGHDGSVLYRARHPRLTPAELAAFLEGFLPRRIRRVPMGLRFTIARALYAVDALPFASLGDFSRDLAHFERRDRAALVRDVWERGSAVHKRTNRVRRLVTGAAAAAAMLLVGIVEPGDRNVRAAAAPAPAIVGTIGTVPAGAAPAPAPIATTGARESARLRPPAASSGRSPAKKASTMRAKRPREPRTGVLDRLHLRWLRKVVK